MESFKKYLAAHHAGRILDIATGDGEFLLWLTGHIAGYDSALGIDTNDARLDEARKETSDPRIRYEVADALKLPFEDGSFDTVSVSNALHHVTDPECLLRELMRVMAPNGIGIIVERIRDVHDVQEQMQVKLHHWWGAVHRAMGYVHNETFTLEELLALLKKTGLTDIVQQAFGTPAHENKRDPFDQERLDALSETIDEYCEKLEEMGGQEVLIAMGRELQPQLYQTGVAYATQLAVIARVGK